MSKKIFFCFSTSMNISFCANCIIKTDKFILPQDTIDDRNNINAAFKEFSRIMENHKINPVWQNYKLDFVRGASKKGFSASIRVSELKPDKVVPITKKPIAFTLTSSKDFTAFQCFKQISYALAWHLKKIDRKKLPFCTNIFKYVMEKLYNLHL